ncbi:GTPase Era [Mesohalobacter halotolerans]|uniref:GTPase Era n=1 Tax=Mesohalobacter halotolerans TaxID=1883405 RepID=A0A4U5TSC1_9FLAO|nr:GTPase Era [Mesohalobacter halotolerans]MBS3737844.1 GTPase Era [Psychroflexus sp.]TKS56751.1 GTPase Era [Mesohalobacter halotolerans]
MTRHKAGFVNIIGNPNVGKSTLMNAFVGEQLSIITSKAQTTRHRILGIVNGDDFQVIFSDTPGIIKPAYELQNAMMKFVTSAIDDADILIYMIEIGEKSPKNEEIFEHIKQTDKPIILLLNKIDKSTEDQVRKSVDSWSKKLPHAEIYAISALNNFGIEEVFKKILEKLPISPAFYPKDSLTDKPERFFVNELVREKILMHYKKEIPYSVEVQTEAFEELDHIININTTIVVERKTQKGIIIGHKGKALNRIGREARKDLEQFFGKKIFLDLYVKIDKNWRSDDRKLKGYGYQA